MVLTRLCVALEGNDFEPQSAPLIDVCAIEQHVCAPDLTDRGWDLPTLAHARGDVVVSNCGGCDRGRYLACCFCVLRGDLARRSNGGVSAYRRVLSGHV